jgi:hypothetical protein
VSCVVPSAKAITGTCKLGLATENGSIIFASVTQGKKEDDNSKKGRFSALQSKLFGDDSLSKPLLPVLIALVAGYRWGARTMRNLEPAAAPRPPYVLQGLVLVLLSREVWRVIPVWLKRQIPFVRRRYKRGVDDDDGSDLSSIATVTLKLQSLFALASDKLASPLTSNELRSSSLALLQLTAQLKARRADLRDCRFEEAGQVVTAADVLTGLDEAFELADMAYDELPEEGSIKDALAKLDFALVKHDKTTLPGVVSHYIAINKKKKVAVIGVKGTSNLEDFLTDSCGNAVTYTLDKPFVQGGGTELRCHEGVLLAAKRLAQDVETVVEELLLPTGYTILITGHSLGAGVAALVAVILRSRFPSLLADDGTKTPRLQVLAFACPPVLDLDSALACAPFTTTIINNSDIMPRASLSNLILTMEFLKIINQKLIEKGIDPKSWKTVAGFLQKMIVEGNGKDEELIMTEQEISDGFDETFDKVELRDPDHLYVPGRVIQMYDLWSKKDYGAERQREKEEDDTALPVDDLLRPAERVMVTDGASNVLRSIEIDARMLSDHMAPAYRSSIRTLLSDPASA